MRNVSSVQFRTAVMIEPVHISAGQFHLISVNMMR